MLKIGRAAWDTLSSSRCPLWSSSDLLRLRTYFSITQWASREAASELFSIAWMSCRGALASQGASVPRITGRLATCRNQSTDSACVSAGPRAQLSSAFTPGRESISSHMIDDGQSSDKAPPGSNEARRRWQSTGKRSSTDFVGSLPPRCPWGLVETPMHTSSRLLLQDEP